MNDETHTRTIAPFADRQEMAKRWRVIGARLGEVVMTRVERLRQKAATEGDDDNVTVRKLAALVLASQRSLEMEAKHARQVREDPVDDEAERRRMAEQLVAEFERRLERELRRLNKRVPDGDAGSSGQ